MLKQAKGKPGRKVGKSVHKEMQRRIKSGKSQTATISSLFPRTKHR